MPGVAELAGSWLPLLRLLGQKGRSADKSVDLGLFCVTGVNVWSFGPLTEFSPGIVLRSTST